MFLLVIAGPRSGEPKLLLTVVYCLFYLLYISLKYQMTSQSYSRKAGASDHEFKNIWLFCDGLYCLSQTICRLSNRWLSLYMNVAGLLRSPEIFTVAYSTVKCTHDARCIVCRELLMVRLRELQVGGCFEERRDNGVAKATDCSVSASFVVISPHLSSLAWCHCRVNLFHFDRVVFIPSPPDRHYVFGMSVYRVRLSVRPFVLSDLVATISREHFEQSWCNLRGIFTIPHQRWNRVMNFWPDPVSECY